jgi:hypothetical protein
LCGGPTPTPSPTASPTPTPTPGPTYTVTGEVFIDLNKNGIKDAGDLPYTGGINLNISNPQTGNVIGNVSDNPSSKGSFAIPNLPAGTYDVSYLTLPNGYKMINPTGFPPTFTVSVGTGNCSAPANAKCDDPASGDISNLNFAISNSIPWIQIGGGGDIRTDNGFDPTGGGVGGGGSTGSFNNFVPATANTPTGLSCSKGAYTLAPTSSGTQGIIYSGQGSANLGQDISYLNNSSMIAGGNYSPIGIGGILRSSYNYLVSVANQAGISPVDLSTNDGNGNPYCSGGISNCSLNPNLPHGIYIATGQNHPGLILTGGPYTFGPNQNYIIMVDGDLYIKTELYVPVGSTLLISASGSIYVDPGVGANYDSQTPNLEGTFSADKNFVIQGTNDCSVKTDSRLNVAGSIMVNAALGGGSFTNNRDLCANDLYCPVFSIQSRPDFILNAPSFIKKSNYTWQEAAP